MPVTEMRKLGVETLFLTGMEAQPTENYSGGFFNLHSKYM